MTGRGKREKGLGKGGAKLHRIVLRNLDAGLVARSQYPEGPATDHLDTGLS